MTIWKPGPPRPPIEVIGYYTAEDGTKYPIASRESCIYPGDEDLGFPFLLSDFGDCLDSIKRR